MSWNPKPVSFKNIKEGSVYGIKRRDGSIEDLGKAIYINPTKHVYKGFPLVHFDKVIFQTTPILQTHPYHFDKYKNAEFHEERRTYGGKRTRKALRKSRRKTSRR
jgi:hypothetical protein